ncbi:MAG: hypothetical protein GQ569_02435 [Methylococcaceae bacterium]|nr:hypothetical protein [Methylococcaceae bacterium]
MKFLSKPEVFKAIQLAKTLDETQGKKILADFGKQQVGMQQMLFGGFPQAIATLDQEMAHLFMDLGFEIICVYQSTLGDMPQNIATPKWMQEKMAELEAEIKKQTTASAATHDNTQIELLEYLTLAVDDFVGGRKDKQEAAMVVYNLLFLTTRLFDSIYDETAPTVH